MICPLEGHECQCDIEGAGICPPCKSPPPPSDLEEIYRLAGDVSMAQSALLAAVGKMERGAPKDSPPVSLDEIERLIDAFGNAAAEEASWTMAIHKAAKYLAARAALMAAIRKLAEKKDA